MSGKKYFPNNWKAYKDSPDDFFITPTFEEFMHWKIGGWELPESVCCVIRESNNKTGKVKEYVYEKESAARNRLEKILDARDSEVTVVNHDAVHTLFIGNEEDYDDE